jgi:hypothetical protein
MAEVAGVAGRRGAGRERGLGDWANGGGDWCDDRGDEEDGA